MRSSADLDPADPAFGGPVGVPEGKVRRPRPKPHDVRRERVLRRLATAPGDVLAVLAPGGFGKSTLVAQWAQASGLPVAWVNLDRADAEPEVLISSILRAVGTTAPAWWGRGVLTCDEPAFTRSVLPRLGAVADQVGTSVLVVLDDVHHLSGERAGRVVEVLVDCLPEGSRVALVGRSSVAGLPLARWRGGGRLVEVGADELAFDSVEVAQFVTSLCEEPPSVATVADVLESTGGWPVAVYLRAKSSDAAVTATLHVEEYLDGEVLPGLNPEVRAFLGTTAILATLSAPACDAVVGGHDSSVLLRQAERESLLIGRLDGPGEWFRLHPLVRERLAHEFEATQPTAAARCHRRAAEWFWAAGLEDEAAHHAIRSGDPDLIADVVWEASAVGLLLGRCRRVLGWLDAIPGAMCQQRVELAMARTWASLNAGDGGAAAHWAQITDGLLDADWRLHLPESSARCAYAVWVGLSGAVGFAAGAELAAAGFAGLPPTHPLRPLARLSEGITRTLAGDAEGEHLIVEAGRLAHAAGVATTEAESLALAGMLRLLAGDVTEGLALVQRGQGLWTEAGLRDSSSTTLLQATASAFAAAIRGDARAAIGWLQLAAQLADTIAHGFPWTAAFVPGMAARTWAALGDREAGLDALRDGCGALSRMAPSPFLSSLLDAADAEVTGLVGLEHLTPAEQRVWALLQTRLTQREIADRLFVSPETVKTQTAAVYRKLHVASRREAQELGERLAPVSSAGG